MGKGDRAVFLSGMKARAVPAGERASTAGGRDDDHLLEQPERPDKVIHNHWWVKEYRVSPVRRGQLPRSLLTRRFRGTILPG
jgi:hypothetical protein